MLGLVYIAITAILMLAGIFDQELLAVLALVVLILLAVASTLRAGRRGDRRR